MSRPSDKFPAIVELNVGGVNYTTSLDTLTSEPTSLLAEMFTGQCGALAKDTKDRYFIDRDGVLFRYVLDYLRNQRLVLPEHFQEKERLRVEAEHFKLSGIVRSINHLHSRSDGTKTELSTTTTSTTLTNDNGSSPIQNSTTGCIVVAYRGTFAFGRDGLADVKFRKMSRILVSGKVVLCRDAFGDTLNESRDPDRGTDDRYTCRYFLKHAFLEQAFDSLYDAGFRLMTSCASGTNSAGEIKPGMDTEESKWNHYNEFVFMRE